MPGSTIGYIKEMARRDAMLDDNFYRRMLYFFELRLPDSVIAQSYFTESNFLFPIILPPESFSMDEPFTVEINQTQGGGLYVEENGILQRTIRLRGHTGFRPRMLKTIGSMGTLTRPMPAVLNPKKKSYSRSLPIKPIVQAISGQRHFQYLQDAVFRTYADLKRDPAMSEGTELIFHNPKDDEHWLVIPQKFTLERDSKEPFLYRYNIEMTAVDVAGARDADFSEEKGIFDKMKDTLRTMKRGIDMATGALHDLTAIQAEVTAFVHNTAKIIDACTTILNAATDFVNGTTDLVEAPLSSVTSTIENIEAAAALISAHKELGDAYASFPEDLLQKFRQLGDAMELLAVNSTSWETPTEATLREIRNQQDLRRALSLHRQAAAALRTPATLQEWRNLGTNLSAGDMTSADGTSTAGARVIKYKSGLEVRINDGDTLVTLAARYMGDARLWQYIAIANGLKPPFIDVQANAPLVGRIADYSQSTGTASGADESPFGRALGVGSKIVIPSNTASTLDLPILPVLGARLDETAESQFLGTDVKLVGENNDSASDRVQYDIPVDSDLGSTDVQTVTGVENLEQVVKTRLRVERGTDLLYQKLGTQRIIGLGMTAVDLENARFRVLESMRREVRISDVSDFDFTYNGDSLEVDITVQIRGFSRVRSLRVLV